MSVSNSCEARVGMVGNPSDGFGGKTISFLLGNFAACVEIVRDDEGSFIFHGANMNIVEARFASLVEFQRCVETKGWYKDYDRDGGISLCMATFSMLVKCLDGMKKASNILNFGFSLKYSTTIPRCVGLSGSSAIIMACWKSLLDIYHLTLEDLGITKEYFHQV